MQSTVSLQEGNRERADANRWCASRLAKSCPTLAAPWTGDHQPPLSLGFPRQEYCSGLQFPSPGDLPDPGIEPGSLALWVDSLPSEPPGKLDGRWDGGTVTTEAEIGGIRPQSRNPRDHQRQNARNGASLQPPRGALPTTLICTQRNWLWTSSLRNCERENFCHFKPRSLC